MCENVSLFKLDKSINEEYSGSNIVIQQIIYYEIAWFVELEAETKVIVTPFRSDGQFI